MKGVHRIPYRFVSSFRLLVMLQVWLLMPFLPFIRLPATAAEARDSSQVELTANQFKAAFLQKLPTRVTWPANAFAGTNTNVVIAILGPDPFDGLLDKLVEDLKVGGRAIVVKAGVDPRTIPECHVLFVPEDQQAAWVQWRKLSNAANAAGVLTIGEHADFLEAGGIVKVLPSKRQFEVHVGNARRNGLHLDPKFVRVASNVIR